MNTVEILSRVVVTILCVAVICKLWIGCSRLSNRLAAPGPSGVENLKILTLNIYMRVWSVYDDKNSRLDRFINVYLQRYDIVCLQEMHGTFTFRCHSLIDRARDLGFKYCVVPKNPEIFSRKLIDSGLVILSRVPIVRADFIPYKSGGYIDNYSEKGFQCCKLSLNGDNLYLVNTHLQSGYNFNDKKAISIRKEQLSQIESYLRKYKDSTIILCGDMNCDANFEEYDSILKILNLDRRSDLLREFSEKSLRPPTSTAIYCTRELDILREKYDTPVVIERNRIL
jgi:endonuclease/exonuclease/phosphatase family metal-dependent hydrolase